MFCSNGGLKFQKRKRNKITLQTKYSAEIFSYTVKLQFIFLILLLKAIKSVINWQFLGGKSSVLLDVKPWDDETDMKKLEEAVRSVEMPGLLWGACMLIFPFHLY